MQENKLLASVVLFRALYDKNKDIYDVIAAFLKAAIVFEKKWAFNTTEATQLLDTTFGFKMPEAVVKTTLKNRLTKQEKLLSFNNGTYTFAPTQAAEADTLASDLDKTKTKQSEIINDLISYIEKRSLSEISEPERAIIVDDFCAYLLDNDGHRRYSKYISSYIIESQSRTGFTESLNAVREGFVLYNGVRYSFDLNDLGSWKTNLTIYLDTEHLFNATGYNGILHKQLFDDFYGLISEINRGGKQLITLKYFDESQSEVENFFHVAELIMDGKVTLNPSKSAMVTILNGSKTKSDILANKAAFYTQLQAKHITVETRRNFYDEPQYNIEDSKLIENIKKETEEKGYQFDEEKCHVVLKKFTAINTLRRGVNRTAFEKVGYILMTGTSFTHSLAFSRLIKAEDKDIPFASDIDFITNRLWFKLKKGLTNQISLPKSLDVIAKAQVVLSSQINNSISDKYDAMKKQLSDGKITRKEAEYLIHELRSNTTEPEDITPDNIENTLAFLNHTDIEHHLREKSILERKAAEGEAAIREIAAIKQQERERKLKLGVLKIKAKLGLSLFILIIFILGSYGVVWYFIKSIRTSADSNLAVLGAMFSFILGTVPLMKYRRIRDKFVSKYKELISKL